MAELQARFGPKWGKTMRDERIRSLTRELVDEMKAWGLMRGPTPAGSTPCSPTAARVAAHYAGEGERTRRRRRGSTRPTSSAWAACRPGWRSGWARRTRRILPPAPAAAVSAEPLALPRARGLPLRRGNPTLTGQDESGKSTVLAPPSRRARMALTPDGVDTMGSNDRSIRDHLIGKDDVQEESPSFHRESPRTSPWSSSAATGRSVTVGIGLRSSRDWTNQKVERRGFAMHGPRAEIDFHRHDGRQPRRRCAPASCATAWAAPAPSPTTSAPTRPAERSALRLRDGGRLRAHAADTARGGHAGAGRGPQPEEGGGIPQGVAAADRDHRRHRRRLGGVPEAGRDRGRAAAAGRPDRRGAQLLLQAPQEATVLASARQAAAAYRAQSSPTAAASARTPPPGRPLRPARATKPPGRTPSAAG